jgi:formylglycine-generating enzyme required for sulfatase activity
MGDEDNNDNDNEEDNDDDDDSTSDNDENEEDNVEQEVNEDPILEKPFVSLHDEAKEKEFQEKRLALIQAMLGTDAQLVQNLRDLNHRIWKAGFQISETRPFARGELAPGYLLSNRVDPDVCLFAISLEKLLAVAGNIAKVEIPTDDFNPNFPEGYFRALRENRVFTLTSNGIGLCGHHWYSTQNAEYFITTNSLTEYSNHVIYIPEKESLDAQLVDYATFPETIKKPLIERFGLRDLSFDTLEFHAFLVKLVIEFEDQELKGSSLDFKEREEVFNHLAVGRSDNPLVSFVRNSLLKKFPDVRIAKEIETILPGPIGTLAAIFQACVRLACLVQNAETLLEESQEDESKEEANHQAMLKLTLDADAILTDTDVLLKKVDTQKGGAFRKILEIYCQLTEMKTPDSFQILIDLNKPWKAGEDPIAYAVLYRMQRDAAMELFFQAPAENEIISIDNILGVIKSGFVPNIRQILGVDPRVDALWLNRSYRLREYGPEFYFSIFEMLYLKENIPYPDDDNFDAEHIATFSRGVWNLENASLALAKGANSLEQDDSGMCILDILQRHIMVASSQKNEADTKRRKDLQQILIRHVAGSGRPMPLNTTNKVLKEIATLLGKNNITAAEIDKLPAETKNELLEISNVALRVYPQMREWVEKYLIGRLWVALKNTSEGGTNLNPDFPTAMRIGASIDKYYQDLAAATLGTPDATKYLDMLNRENFFSLLDDRTLKLRVLNSNFEDWPRMSKAGALIKEFFDKAEVLLIFGAPLEDENLPTATTTLATLDPEIKAEYPTIHKQLFELDPTSLWVSILDCMLAIMNCDESQGSLQFIFKKLEALKAKLGLKTGIFNPYYHFLASQYHRLNNDWNASLEAFSLGVRLVSCSFNYMEKVIIQHITKIHLGEFIPDDANGDWEQTDEEGMKKFLAALESVITKYPAESDPSKTDWFVIRAQVSENLEMYNPSKAISLYNQAGSYSKTKKKEAAYAEAFELDPFFFWSANNMAWHLAARSDKPYLRNGEKAVAWAEKTLTQLKTNSWSAWDTLAAAHAANGEFEKAINAIKQAKKYAPISELNACDILYDRYSQGLSHFDPKKLLEDLTLSRSLANKKLAKLLGLYDGSSSITNSLGMTFGKIFPAEFTMGGLEYEEGFAEEEFRHRVRITKPYFLGRFAVTQHCWEKIMGDNPSKHKAVDFPVSQISWEQANDFCTRLSNLPEEQQAQRSYRLPTEAEWEYACRAGSSEAFSTGGSLSEDEARFSDDCDSVAKPPVQVGTLPPNNFGFYEMHGNVWEWCSDWFDEEYYKNSPLEDPQGPETGDHHTLRGGSASVQNYECRAATRGEAEQDKPSKDSGQRFAFIGDLGLRVVCVVKEPQ